MTVWCKTAVSGARLTSPCCLQLQAPLGCSVDQGGCCHSPWPSRPVCIVTPWPVHTLLVQGTIASPMLQGWRPFGAI